MTGVEQTEITIFEARWNERFFGVGSSEAVVREMIENHYAYGDPESDNDYRVGTQWAENCDGIGWRIEPRNIVVDLLGGKIYGNLRENETSHLVWVCNSCQRKHSEDIYEEDKCPFLVYCSCGNEDQRRYALVRFS